MARKGSTVVLAPYGGAVGASLARTDLGALSPDRAGGQGAGELGEALPGGALSVARAGHGTPFELPLEQDATGGRAALTSLPRGRVRQEGACRGLAEGGSHRRRILREEAPGAPEGGRRARPRAPR